MKRPTLLLLVVVAMTLAIPRLGDTAAFPEKGRAIMVIVPWTAGGSLDLSARLLSAELEKILMTPVQVVNKPGASGQVGTTQIVLAKPDGYTIGVTSVPSTSTIYLDPDRKAAFGRKDLAPVARHTADPMTIGVSMGSKYKTLKDLIDDAKARPEGIKVGCSGILSAMHLGILMFQKATGTKFAVVQFDGGAPAMTALVGGHLDVVVDVIGTMASHIKAGTVRLLGIMDKEPSKFLPEVKTLESQGVKVYSGTARAYSAPAGTPKDIVDTLSAAIKKATDSEAHVKRLAEMYTTVAYLDAAQFAAYWDEVDAQVKPLIGLAKE